MSIRVQTIEGMPGVEIQEQNDTNGYVFVVIDGTILLTMTRNHATKLGKELLSWAYSVEAEVELDKMTFKKKGT